ncbi:MAG: TldD/PmbA family protein [Alphaproteobacteria bacterium]|jgi:predicted Zn-dependent protease|nr:TldD/PmbA family protein [Alphaproteobacteria bacterium]
MLDLQHLLSSLDIQADWVGLRLVKEHMTVRFARNGNLDPLSISHDVGMMVEVLIQGQFAYAGTSDLSLDGVKKAARRAVEQAKRLAKYQLFPFDPSLRPPSTGSYKSPTQSSAKVSKSPLNELAVEISCLLKMNDKIINTEAMFMSIEEDMSFVSSNGANFTQTFQKRGVQLLATAQEGNIIQTRTNGFRVAQAGDEFFEEALLKEQATRIAAEAIELSHCDVCPTGVYDLLLMPDQLYLQIHESIGHPLELDRILGDERNYAGWSFIKPQDFGTLQYGSDLLNVTFDPGVPHELASYQYDDNGAPATRQYLIKEGQLLRGIGGLESQRRSKLPGVSSAKGYSWNRTPIDRIANINIEPGSSSLDEMIAATERGVLMKTNKSWSIDDYRNKFQFGCEYGQVIENGKLTKTVRNPNYRGITTPFWKGLKMVGDHADYEIHGSMYCGKGEPNQLMRVGHATPPCLFTDVEVFGGGA